MHSTLGLKIIKYGAYTANFDTKERLLDVGIYKEANFYINVLSSSGTTPTLDIDVVSKHPTQDYYDILASFTQITTTGTQLLKITSNLGINIALDIKIAGDTPSFSFYLEGTFKT